MSNCKTVKKYRRQGGVCGNQIMRRPLGEKWISYGKNNWGKYIKKYVSHQATILSCKFITILLYHLGGDFSITILHKEFLVLWEFYTIL